MVALTQDRNTPQSMGDIIERPVRPGFIIYAGSIVCQEAAGQAMPGQTGLGIKVLGRAENRADNMPGGTGNPVRVKRGIFRVANSTAADQITGADIGADAYLVDDQTVAKTSGSNTRSIAGRIMDVDHLGVWVRLGE